MVDEYLLTTIDNPFNPWTQKTDWQKFDDEMGHNTNGYLATFAFESENLGENEEMKDIQTAIQMAIDEDPLGIYIRVKADTVLHPISIDKYLQLIS